MSLQPADPLYYFRVDTHLGLRALVDDDFFRPARWDNRPSPFPHVALLAEAQRKKVDEAIYRISFWINEDEARRDLALRGSLEPHVLLRVARGHVAHALGGWNFDEDDFLPGQADLIWHRGTAVEGRFFSSGVRLEQFEVWEDAQWRPWPLASAFHPDNVRMARIGWHSIALMTRQGEPIVAYWQLVCCPADT